jgi:hypothetical protein
MWFGFVVFIGADGSYKSIRKCEEKESRVEWETHSLEEIDSMLWRRGQGWRIKVFPEEGGLKRRPGHSRGRRWEGKEEEKVIEMGVNACK